jgi:hypothetical protein
MRPIVCLTLSFALTSSQAYASQPDAGAQLVTSFKFQVKYGSGPNAVTLKYDDNTNTPVRIGLPDTFEGWSCTRMAVTSENNSDAGGYRCTDGHGYTLKLAVVWCSTTWVGKQSSTATIQAPDGTSVSLATQCETTLGFSGIGERR